MGKLTSVGYQDPGNFWYRFTYQPWNLPLWDCWGTYMEMESYIPVTFSVLIKLNKPRVQSPLPCKNCCSLVLIKGQICFCRGRSALLFQRAPVNPDLWFLSTKALQVGGWGPAKARFIYFRLTCVQSRPSVSFFSPLRQLGFMLPGANNECFCIEFYVLVSFPKIKTSYSLFTCPLVRKAAKSKYQLFFLLG